jgi:hypothetical protein
MRLSIDVDGTRVVERELLGMSARTLDLSPAMRDIRDIVYKSNRAQFATEGAHGGEPWTPPSPRWTARKATLGLDTKTEQATGDLRASLTGRRRGSYSRAGKSSLSVGTTVPYAKYARRRNTLVRPTELERREMVRVVQRHIVSARRGILDGAL